MSCFYLKARYSFALVLSILTLCLSVLPASAGPFRIKSAGKFKIYYATTRYNESRSKNFPVYQGNRHLDLGSGSVEYGEAQVKVPSRLTPLESAPNFIEYQRRHKVSDTAWSIARVSNIASFSKGNFDNSVRAWNGAICLFVHGYDESFNDSIRDTAVLNHELQNKLQDQNISVLPILFSWPSQDKTTEYAADESSMNWSKLPFRHFVEQICQLKKPQTKLYIIAHSLGSRMAFDLTNSEYLRKNKSIDKIVLSSSDFDFHQALQKIELLESLVKEKIFVLVSDRDGPLMTSQLLHNSPRLGRPFDPPAVRSQPKAYTQKSFWKGLFRDAVDLLYVPPQSTYDSPEVTNWLKNGKTKEVELGRISKFYDVTELVTRDLGHRLAWPVITSLIAKDSSLHPLATQVVHKMPDKLLLKQSSGIPKTVYRFYRVSQQRYGLR